MTGPNARANSLVNSQDRALRERAAAVIPNGMYGHESVRLLPPEFPQFFARGQGAHLWDADGNCYLDLMCGYGPNLLGYGHPKIDAAAAAQQRLGDAMTGPSPVMVELAEAFVALVAHADWAMFCKNGTDATTMAMMTARAHTTKRKIIVAKGAYHGAAPWCTPVPTGTLPDDRAHSITCLYNDVESLEAAAAAAGDDLAGIFASPFKHDAFVDQQLPNIAYAKRAREICDETGALLIVDDVRAGFRLARDCSWSSVGVKPDLSCWGKSIANGYPISALLGADKARAAAGLIYVTGSFWFAAVPMAAALATLREISASEYLERSEQLGLMLRAGLREAATRHGFALRQTGPVQMPLILFEEDADFRIGYAWSAQMVKRGIYVHPWHNMFLCAAMTERDIAEALQAADASFEALKAQRTQLVPHTGLMAMLAARH
ncbi:MAG: aminotransferase class III-fold pyridoxal phosphate-dependent enzyme [Proteobacteria bacterium]|nr:aminotransferase class III-fold pyridoxal phosphate-dependent enzyme [Pseudomonadota bacterium]